MSAPSERAALPVLQATCVLVGAAAVLIRGEPGSGKSSLAAALLSRDGPRRLVRLGADDAVFLRAAGGRLVAIAPPPVAGLLEMRGLGLLVRPHEGRAVVRLIVDLVDPRDVERLPGPPDSTATVAGVVLPRLALPVRDPAAPERVLAAPALLGPAGPAGARRRGGR